MIARIDPRIRAAVLAAIAAGGCTTSAAYDGGTSSADRAPAEGSSDVASIPLLLAADRGGASDVVVSLGVPFAPGVLRDAGGLSVHDAKGSEVAARVEPLARWPTDGSLRSVLVAFHATLGSGASARYAIRTGARSARPRPSDVAPNPDGPIAATLPASWYAASLVIGPQQPASDDERFPDFESGIEHGLAAMDPPYDSYGVSCDGSKQDRTYYDGVHAMYQRFLRGADAAMYRRARAEAVWYRAHELRRDGPIAINVCERRDWTPASPLDWSVLRRMLGEGNLDDYLLTGDPSARSTVLALGETIRRDLPALISGHEIVVEATERNMAWPMMALASSYAIEQSPVVLEALRALVDRAVAWQARGHSGAFEHDVNRPDPEECDRGAHGGSPFMTALLVDALMEYESLTHDDRIPSVVRRVATWLESDAATSDGRAFRYLWGCDTDPYDDSSTADLNLLIVPVFGAAYALTGDRHFITVGDRFAATGVDAMNVHDPKHWNQSMRAFGKYLGYRRAAPMRVEGAR